MRISLILLLLFCFSVSECFGQSEIDSYYVDSTFGVNGSIIIPVFKTHDANLRMGMVEDPTSKKIFIHPKESRIPMNEIYSIICVSPDGTIDKSFGEDGVCNFNKLLSVKPFNDSDLYDNELQTNIHCIIPMPDHKLQLIGEYSVYHPQSESIIEVKFFIAQLHANGTLDINYGDQGFFLHERIGESTKIWRSFINQKNETFLYLFEWGNPGIHFPLIKVTNKGKLDNKYGEDGILNVDPGILDTFEVDMVKASDGFYFTFKKYPLGHNPTIIRKLTEEGKFDKTFGKMGIKLYEKENYSAIDSLFTNPIQKKWDNVRVPFSSKIILSDGSMLAYSLNIMDEGNNDSYNYSHYDAVGMISKLKFIK
jgi:hypothetical protein